MVLILPYFLTESKKANEKIAQYINQFCLKAPKGPFKGYAKPRRFRINYLIIPTNIYAGNKNMKIKLNPAQLKEENLAVLLEKRYFAKIFRTKS